MNPGREKCLSQGQKERDHSQIYNQDLQAPLQTPALSAECLQKWVTRYYARKVPAKDCCKELAPRPYAVSLLTCRSTASTDTAPGFSRSCSPAGLTPCPTLQMVNTAEKARQTLRRFPDIHQGRVRIQEGEVFPGEAAISKDKRSLQMPRPASSSLPPTPGGGNAPHPALGQVYRTKSHPIPLIQTLGRWVLGFNWLNTAPMHPHPPTQIRNDLDSGEDGRKVLEKQELKVLDLGPRKEGAKWASLVTVIARSWSQKSLAPF